MIAFDVCYTTQKKGQTWRSNNVAVVITTTAERAIELVKQQVPDAVIEQINHRGRHNGQIVIIDKEQE